MRPIIQRTQAASLDKTPLASQTVLSKGPSSDQHPKERDILVSSGAFPFALPSPCLAASDGLETDFKSTFSNSHPRNKVILPFLRRPSLLNTPTSGTALPSA